MVHPEALAIYAFARLRQIDSGDYLQMTLEWVEVFFTIPLPSILLLLWPDQQTLGRQIAIQQAMPSLQTWERHHVQ